MRFLSSLSVHASQSGLIPGQSRLIKIQNQKIILEGHLDIPMLKSHEELYLAHSSQNHSPKR
jgi:hypothetical protein